jgi:hypothetical protein
MMEPVGALAPFEADKRATNASTLYGAAPIRGLTRHPKLGLDSRPPRLERITLLSFSPDNVHETGVSPGGRYRSPIVAPEAEQGRENSEEDQVTGPIEVFVPYSFATDAWRSGR